MASKGFLIGTVFNAPPPMAVECTTYESSPTDYLQSDLATLSIGDVWTIAFWQKRTTDPQTNSAVLWEAVGSNGTNGRIRWEQNLSGVDTDNRFQIRTDAGANAKQVRISNLAVAGPLAGWEHIVLVYNSNGGANDTWRLYFNGAEITNKTGGESLGFGDPYPLNELAPAQADQTDTVRSFTIGAARGGGTNVEGSIYNLGMWDVELSSAAILSLYNNSAADEIDLRDENGSYTSQANLQHYWRFDNALDRGEDLGVATPHDLLFADSGSHTFVTNDCPQFVPEAANTHSLLYDKTFLLSSKTATNVSGIDASSGSSYTFSFATWAKFTGTADAGRNALVAVRQTTAASALDWGLDDNSNTDLTCILVNAAQSGRQFQTWHDVVTPGAWHHIVLTWDGTTGTGVAAGGPHCYVDGVLVDDAGGRSVTTFNSDGSGFNNAATRYIKVGTQIGSNTNWEGPIYTSSIYNSVLAAAEVAELYASGNAQAVNPRVNTGNYVSAATLLHYYQPGLGVTDVEFGTDYTLTQPPIGLSSGNIANASDLTTDIP